MATIAISRTDDRRVAGTLLVDAYVIDTLMPDLVGHDRQPSAFLVYLFLWRQTQAGRRRSAPLTLRQIAEGTGLSKRAVQGALTLLARRRLTSAAREGPTDAGEFVVRRPWRDRGR